MNEHLQELRAGGRPMKKWEIEMQEKDKEIERLSIELNQCMIDHNKLLDRIDKAIEYIEQHNYPQLDEMDYYSTSELLDILKGDDKE